jgi:TnpA family transposase
MVHGDTHAQSVPVFALAHLLGINLMPRIRDVKDLVFCKATGAGATRTSSRCSGRASTGP